MAATEALENAVTKVTATHMTSAVESCVVTAKAEQIPSTWRVIGLLFTIGSNRTFLGLGANTGKTLLRGKFLKIVTECITAEPIFDHIIDTPTGNRSTR